VILPAALPGIVGGVLLAVSRAIGETMIVVMAAGLAANLTANPLDSVTTVTVQIVTLLTGDQEFDSAKTLAAFALGLTLFVVTLTLNVIALHIVRKYREQYEFKDRKLIGQAHPIWVPADDDVDMLVKGHMDGACRKISAA
jgi:phosphate transport system permease protein